MNISIVGYGRMGRLIEQVAVERQLRVSSRVDPFHPEATHKVIDQESMEGVDVCICFTQPDAALGNMKDISEFGKQIVIGTTGWTDKMPEVEKMVQNAGNGLVYSSNFSIGVNIFFKLVEQAGQVMNQFEVYDVLCHEAHHNKKMDSPSGTAVTIGKILLDNIDRKKKLATERLDRKIEGDELHFASMRGGHIPGTHAVVFDSEFDSIEIKHTARNRLGFATGAVIAAEWIKDKKGLYTEADMMKQLLG